METSTQQKAIRVSFWGAFAFYFLIAFEFFYMAGPFAAFFYSAYAPALNFFNASPALAWLNSFFLPHSVRETSSVLINSLEIAGAILALTGFLAFCVGACQVYYHKIAKKGIVTGGIYNRIRHPQYTAFIVCSFGLLILWPRYIVAILFVTMLFFYYLLAKVEESECERKFGQDYIDFKKRTTMFLPFKLTFLRFLPKPKLKKATTIICIYLFSVILTLLTLNGLKRLTIESLYANYTSNSATVSLCKMSPDTISSALSIALSSGKLEDKLSFYDDTTKFINYILPVSWFAAEIPMNGIEYTKGHESPSNFDPNLYKIIITKAIMRNQADASGKEILTSVYLREPIAEVWIDLSTKTVTSVLDMPKNVKYQGIPVAVF